MKVFQYFRLGRSMFALVVLFLILSHHSSVLGSGYTPKELILLADDMLRQFNSMPLKKYGEICANVEPNPEKNMFYKYVINVKSELFDISYRDPEALLIKCGNTFFAPWKKVKGWKCIPGQLECRPPDDYAMRQEKKWVITYSCKCAVTVVTLTGNGTRMEFPSSLIPGDSSIQCRYDLPDSYCSAKNHLVQCKNLNNMCLIDEFDIACSPENYAKLLSYLNERGIPRRSDDCQCRPKNEEVAEFDIAQWSSVDYVLANKTSRLFGQTCANVKGLVDALFRKYLVTTDKYKLPPEAQPEFDALRNNPTIAPCDKNRELYCDLLEQSDLGTCRCNPIPVRSGYEAHPDYFVTPTGHCALAYNSDCSTGIDNNFTCFPPDQCIIDLVNATCSIEKILEILNNTEQYGVNDEERYLKRCRCISESSRIEFHVVKVITPPKFPRRRPIFDLGYGIDGSDNLKLSHNFGLFFVSLILVYFCHFPPEFIIT